MRLDALTLAGVPLLRDAEPLHWLLAGSTGAGKTTAIAELLDGIRARGDRCIVCDPNGGYVAQFAEDGDRLLNPFDARSERWSLFNELRRDFDAERLARSVVPDGQGESAAWHGYAQALLAELLRALLRNGETTTERLLYWAGVAPAPELARLLAGTPAAGLFDADAAKALASTRFVLATRLAPQRYLAPGAFSLRNWLETEAGSLFLTWRSDMQAALAPLLGTWVDVLANAVLSLPADPRRRLWFIVDELAALGPLASLEAALTLGRKHGLCVVAGLQSTAQLDRLYGKDAAVVLRSCFRNLLVLAIARTDPDTCEALSRALGEREVQRTEASRSQGSQGTSRGVSLQVVQERLVLASEIATLANLQGYLALAGDTPVRRVSLLPQAREVVTEAYAEEAAC
ncbi:type IV secretory system Conjugative DNA transfer family protein [Burkholderia pseudomallei MSHR5613]|uniref:type IV secretion system DNA-binding domain-containing protein n=1 Tax=Burkholderia pseudomallei TaxID=28450 RepID=UPI000531093D|nr:type IV secretion system DNA-binding domain-containing protein [Burkholderia pseudomallei]KGS55498.1 type IV secretory system Conjugative DNA transfer family protein [Burkholderia pseudomallei MSHR5613]